MSIRPIWNNCSTACLRPALQRGGEQARSLIRWLESQLHEDQVFAEPVRAFIVRRDRHKSERPVEGLGLCLKIASVEPHSAEAASTRQIDKRFRQLPADAESLMFRAHEQTLHFADAVGERPQRNAACRSMVHECQQQRAAWRRIHLRERRQFLFEIAELKVAVNEPRALAIPRAAPRNEISNERRSLCNVLVGLRFDDQDGGVGKHWQSSHGTPHPSNATGWDQCPSSGLPAELLAMWGAYVPYAL